MAVIAKMNVNDVKEFPEGVHKFFLSTVCENGLMAHYNPENEDAVFTKYSPCGQCEITVGPELEKPEKGSQVYVMFHEAHGTPSFEGACFAKLARVGYVTDYGQSKQVALGTAAPLWSQEENRLIELPVDLIPENRAVGGRDFELKLTIDNPHASVQFVPQGLYLISFYDASKLTMDEVLRLARA
jgi:hypothetical protein